MYIRIAGHTNTPSSSAVAFTTATNCSGVTLNLHSPLFLGDSGGSRTAKFSGWLTRGGALNSESRYSRGRSAASPGSALGLLPLQGRSRISKRHPTARAYLRRVATDGECCRLPPPASSRATAGVLVP